MLLNCGVGETLEGPLDCKEIKPVNPKGNQSRVFIGRTDVEAETLILWPPDAKSWFIWKDPDAGKDWRQEKGMTEDEMVGWHHQLSGHEFEQTPKVGDGQGDLACCSPWGCKELDMTEWTELKWFFKLRWLTCKHQGFFCPVWNKSNLELCCCFLFVRLFVLMVNTIGTSLVAQMVMNLPALWETQVQSWVEKIPWRRGCLPTLVFLPGEFHEPGRLQFMGSQRVRHDCATNTFMLLINHSCVVIWVPWFEAIHELLKKI